MEKVFRVNHCKTNEIIEIPLDSALLPETVAFFESYEDTELSTYEFATQLVNFDKTAEKPRELFDFIVELYQIAIEEGNVCAMNDLGAFYYDGYGCEQDFTKAVFYYEMAASHGDRQAQENLGYCYYYGRNVPVDYQKAFHYFALGAFDGHLISLYKIGDMYMNGYYVEKNPREAFYIYQRCMDTMTETAASMVAGPVLLRLGNAYLYGNGTEQDLQSALVCFQRAEYYLYQMVAGGDVMYRKSLQAAIDGQDKARSKRMAQLPTRHMFD